MRDAVTISLPPELAHKLDLAAEGRGISRSQYIQELLKRDLFLEHLEQARKRLVPLARKRGIYTDEDVFRLVS
jgi:metal-responsive CopG/Arc/MetJ family transcriptional regulator